MTAAYKGHSELVDMLREKGSSWETKDRSDFWFNHFIQHQMYRFRYRSGLTALHYAVDNSHLAVVKKAIEEGANVKAKDKFGWSPLMRGGEL